MPTIIICSERGEKRNLLAKGLCGTCYHRLWAQKDRETPTGNERRKRNLRVYYHHDREKIIAQNNAHARQNRERYNQYGRSSYQRNRDKIALRTRAYYESHKKQYREYCRHWDHEHRAYRRLQALRRQRLLQESLDTLTPEQAQELLVIGRATYPGEALHLDHVVPISRGGGTTRGNIHAIPACLNLAKGALLPQQIYKQLELADAY